MNEMKLRYEVARIDDVQFDALEQVKDHVLYINKENMLAYLRSEKLTAMDVDIARPGESVRIVPVKDVIEPRIKLPIEQGSFPGYFGSVDDVGSGTTKA